MKKNNSDLFTKKLQVLFVGLFSAAILTIAHALGTELFLYWIFPWFDIATHALGGIAIGSLFSVLFFEKQKWLIIPAVIVTLIGWEIFEMIVKNIPIDIFDTILDVFVGGLAATLTLRWCFCRLQQ